MPKRIPIQRGNRSVTPKPRVLQITLATRAGCLSSSRIEPTLGLRGHEMYVWVRAAERVMSSYARYCREQAEDCARRARVASSPQVAANYRTLENRWLSLAKKAELAAVGKPLSNTLSNARTF